MKASDLTQAGYYWCTHDLGMWIPDGQQYSREWHVMQLDGYGLWVTGGEIEIAPNSVPDYVNFIGPLEPPA